MDGRHTTEVGALHERVAALEAELAACRQELQTLHADQRDDAHVFEVVAAHMPHIVERFDRELRHIYVSPSIRQLTGQSAEACLGKTSRELGAPEEMAALFESALRQVFATGQHATFDYPYPALDRQVRWFEARLVPELGAAGSVASVLAIEHDITERKQAEAALRASEERFRHLAENLADALWIRVGGSHGDRPIVYVNPAFERIFGVRAADVYQSDETWLALIHPEDRARVKEATRACSEGETDCFNTEYRITRHDGTQRWIWARAFAVRDDAGRPLRTIGLAQDITERKESEAALRAGEARFREVADNLAEALSIRVPRAEGQTHLMYANPAFERMFGVRAAEVYASDAAWTGHVHPADRERVVNALDAYLTGAAADYDVEYRLALPDGAVRWIWARAFAIRDDQGRLLRSIGLAEDITTRKEATDSLVEERNLLRTLIDHLPDAIFLKDAEGRFVTCNLAAAQVHGTDNPAELVGKTLFGAVMPDLEQRYRADDLAVMRAGQPLLNLEEPIVDAAGERRWYLTTKVPRRDAQGNVVGVIGISHDITNRKQAEESLRESEARFRYLADNLEDAVWMRARGAAPGQPFPLLYANPAYERIFGITIEHGYRSDAAWSGLIDPVDRERVVNALQAFLSGTANSYNVEYRITRPDGARRWIWARAVPIRDAQGRLQRVIGLTQDITARKQHEDLLAAERNLLRTLIDHLPDAIFLKDAEGRFVTCNLANARLQGYETPDQLVGLTTFDTDPPELAEQYRADDLMVMQSGQAMLQRDEPIVDATGQTRWFSTTKVPRRDGQGNVVGIIGISRDVTDYRQATEALAAERNLLRTLIDNLPDLIYVKDLQGRFLVANEAVAQVMGAGTPDGVLGKTDFDFHPADIAERYCADDLQVIQSGQPLLERKEPIPHTSLGEVRWFLSTKVPRRDAAGNTVGLIGISRDVTKDRQAADALAAERNLLRTLIDHMPDAVFLKDVEGRYVACNLAFARLYGYDTPDDMVGKTTFDTDPLELAEQYRVDDLQVMQSGQAMLRREEPIVDAAGRTRWFSTTKVPRRDGPGNVVGLIGISHDITNWKAAAEAREDQLRFEQLLATVSAGFVEMADGQFGARVRHSLQLVGQYLGADRVSLMEAAPGQPPRVSHSWAAPGFEPLSPGTSTTQFPCATGQMLRGEFVKISNLDDLPAEWEVDRQALAESGVKAMLAVPLRAGGALLGILACSSLTQPRDWSDAQVQRVGLLAQVFAGALARMRADHALRQSEQRFRTMADFTYDWEYWSAPDGSFVYISPACQRITGYRPEEFLRTPDLLNRLVHPDDAAAFAEHQLREAVPGEAHRTELRIVTRDGEERWIGHVCQPVYGDDGGWLGWRASNRDITGRKQAEEAQARLQAQLIQSQKMEAIGRLTAGIAHDFNNLLTVINGFAELLQVRLTADESSYDYADKIITAGQRAASLVAKLMAFSRKQMLQPRVVDLNEVVAAMDAMLHRLIGEDIELVALLAAELWPVRVDPTQIEQVILNLAVNARDAMPIGGRLAVELSNITLTEERLLGADTMPPGDYARLTVRDSGSGMSDAVKAHLFEPFFTTKPLGQGTGLGLATVYGIVRQSEGYVEVTSEPGRGTTFDIYLPRTAAAAPPPRHGTAPLAPRGVETVLVVEDDAQVLQLACHVLRHRGYHVLEAANAQAAMRVAGEYAGRIHLLLSDVVMPGLSGKDLARQLTAARPGIKVILMSGYIGDVLGERAGLARGIEFVQKPIGALDLALKVRQVLDTE